MNKQIIPALALTLAGILLLEICTAQSVSIITIATTPDLSAMLDIKQPNKGLLIPRVVLINAVDTTTIPSPAVSLLV